MRLSRLVYALAFVALPGLLACSSEDGPPDDPPGPTCGYHDECGTGQVCFDGACKPTASCVERRNCRNVPICADDRCFCDEDSNRCLPACELDDDCPADGYCLNGTCTRYPATFTSMPPPESGTRGSLQVGLARVPLDYPMGVSMAGYGSRSGPRTPYQDSLGGSHSWIDRPDVRAAVFDDGAEMFVLLRIPTSWSTDFMLTRTAEKVAERTGVNLLDRIITSSPHSHSHPARYWHLVVGLGFGFFGYGEFSGEVFERMTDSFADAIELALLDVRPARFGYAVLPDFDPNRLIHRDRRARNNNLPGHIGKDPRMVIMRVDDLDGTPRAVFTNFGIHGTVFGANNPVLTGDAGGGVEVELTHAASAKWDRPVMGFFIQGNAGDISPGGDNLQHNDFERLQVIGRRTWAVMEPALDAIETSADVEVGFITGRVPISHSILGYPEDGYFDADVSCEATPQQFRYGAFQCVEGTFDDDDPATKFTDGDLNCVFSVECLTGGYPVPQFQKTVLSTFRLGSLAMSSMPGEPLSQFGLDTSAAIAEAIDGVTDAAIVGYSQDHHFYLLHEDDWLQGGYEPSRDIWGWNLGQHLTDNAVAIASELNQAPEARTWEEGNLKPMYWPLTAEELAVHPLTASEAPSAILEDVPDRVERLSEVTFAWGGGHPGADLPHVTLQVATEGGFIDFTRPGGLVYDDAGFEMMVTYEGDCNRSRCDDHRWRVRWQETRDFPLGLYRFVVEGEAYDGSTVSPYRIESAAFEVVPSEGLQVMDVALNGDRITGTILDPAQVALTETDDGSQAEDNAFLLRADDVPGRLGGPLPDGVFLQAGGRLTPSGGEGQDFSVTAQARIVDATRKRLTGYDTDGNPRYAEERSRPTSTFEMRLDGIADLPAGDYWLELTLTDDEMNVGTFTATITK